MSNVRGKISDRAAYNRMRKHVINVLDTYDVWDRHTIAKALYDDDMLVIRGYERPPKGRYGSGFAFVELTVTHALQNNGIEYTAKEGKWPFSKGRGLIYILIPIDQEACPQARKPYVSWRERQWPENFR